MFTQPTVEAVLRRAAAALPMVTDDTGLAVVCLRQVDDHVLLRCRAGDGSEHEREVRARYAIGCNRASSTVRTLACIALQDLSFDEPWLVVDVLSHAQGLAKLPATSVQCCKPERPCS